MSTSSSGSSSSKTKEYIFVIRNQSKHAISVKLLRLLTGLFFFLSGSGTGISCTGITTGSSATASHGTDIGEESADVLSLEGLCEKTWPVALDCVSASLNDLAELFFLLSKRWLARYSTGRFELVTYRDFEITVVEEKSSVCANESILFFWFQSRYCNLCHFSYLIII